MKNYLDLMRDILQNGHNHVDRTGVGRRSVFGRELRFDLQAGFPLVTTRKVFTRGFIEEMVWFLSGSTNALELEAKGVNIWKAWTPTQDDANALIEKHSAKNGAQSLPESIQLKLAGVYLDMEGEDVKFEEAIVKFITPNVGSIGPMYGAIWRGNYDAGNGKKGPDQIAALIEGLRTNPFGSRHTVTAQIPSVLPVPGFSPKENVLLGQGALAPCHCFFQCFVTPPVSINGFLRLSLKLEIRSSDGPVGLPYNIAQYALLLTMLAQCVDMVPHELIVSIGDSHAYKDQIEMLNTQIGRIPHPLPTMVINPAKTNIFDFTIDDFKLENYQCHPVIKYPVAT